MVSQKRGKNKCKHDFGWVTERNPYLFIFPTNEITLNDGSKGKKQKIEVRCNIPSCDKIRNLYVEIKLIGFGKIRKKW